MSLNYEAAPEEWMHWQKRVTSITVPIKYISGDLVLILKMNLLIKKWGKGNRFHIYIMLTHFSPHLLMVWPAGQY